jgi:ABC-2 type transport system permease protein
MMMAGQRLISLIRKEFLHIIRDPRTLALALVMPVMQLLLLGYAATNDVRNVPMAVFDQDRGSASRRLLAAYRAADYFRVEYDVGSEEEMRQLVDEGKVRAGLIIPSDYSARLQGEERATLAFVLDGSDPTVASTALSAARRIAQEHAAEIQIADLARRGGPEGAESPIEVRSQVWYNPDMVSAHFMVPGVIGMILYSITSILTATAIVRERERGTIEQLIVTPIRSGELILGKIIPYVILAFLDILTVLVLGSLLFKVPIRGDLTLIMLLSALFLLSGLGIGLFASTVANTQQEAMLLVFMTLLPAIFLSGFFFPLEAMPEILQWISLAMPLRYYLAIIRSLLLKGVGIEAIRGEVMALAIFGVVIMSLAATRFRKRLD